MITRIPAKIVITCDSCEKDILDNIQHNALHVKLENQHNGTIFNKTIDLCRDCKNDVAWEEWVSEHFGLPIKNK